MKTNHLISALFSLGLLYSALIAAEPAQPPAPAVPPVLAPLNAKIGTRYNVKGIVLSFRAEQTLTEEQWKAIEGLGIRVIATGGKGLDDAAIARLAKLNPEGLTLDGSAITDDGCKYLAAMKSLRWLSIGHTTLGKNGFKGSGLAQLKALPSLERLGLGGTTAGDEAMDAIGELSQLKEFSSWHTHFTLASNSAFLKLTRLEKLTLGNSMPAWDGKPRRLSLTDSTVEVLSQVSSLQDLTLMQANLTLPALMKLKALPKLKTLKFQDVNLEPADLEKLKVELPNVTVTYKPLTEEDKKKLADFLTHK